MSFLRPLQGPKTSNQRIQFGLIFLACLLTSRAMAGSWTSGGGNAVVCRKPGGNAIISAQLLDLYEWQVLENIKPQTDSRPFAIQALDAARAVARGTAQGLIGRGRGDAFVVEKTRELIAEMKLIPSGLDSSQDSSHFVVPNGCKVEPLARYQLQNDRLYVVDEIWQKLDETNKAALIVHEALYAFLRIYGEKNSDRVRGAVARAFAGVQFSFYLDSLFDRNVLWCQTEVAEGDVLPWMAFALYPLPTGSVRVQFVSIAGRQPISKAYGDIFGIQWPLVKSSDFFSYFAVKNTVGNGTKIALRVMADQFGQTKGSIDIGTGVARPPTVQFVCEDSQMNTPSDK